MKEGGWCELGVWVCVGGERVSLEEGRDRNDSPSDRSILTWSSTLVTFDPSGYMVQRVTKFLPPLPDQTRQGSIKENIRKRKLKQLHSNLILAMVYYGMVCRANRLEIIYLVSQFIDIHGLVQNGNR